MNTAHISEKLKKTRFANTTIGQARTVQGTHAQLSGIKTENRAAQDITLDISEEGRQKQQQMQTDMQAQKMQMEMYIRQMQKGRENAEENSDELGKIMTIFRRIANGDIVPWSDEKKLMEYNSEMYQVAKNIAAMKENEDPEEYDSVDKDKKDRKGGAVDADEAVEEIVNSTGSSGGGTEVSGETSI